MTEEKNNLENNNEEKNQETADSKEDFVNIDDLAKLDLRVGLIKEAEKVEGSEKLIKCTIDFGELGTRTIVSGIAKYRAPEDLVGKKFLYIVNLKPRVIFGIESQGMLLAAQDDEGNFAMLQPDAEIKAGAKLS